MTVAVQQPKDDFIGDILKGLNIAQTIYGINTDRAKLEEMRKANEKKLASEAATQSGALRGSDITKYKLEKGAIFSDQKFDGAQEVRTYNDETGQYGTTFIKIPDKTNKDAGGLTPYQTQMLAKSDRSFNHQVSQDNKQEESKKRERIVQAQNGFEQISKTNRARLEQVQSGRKLADSAVTNPVAASALTGSLARLSGEIGALTDSDLQRFGGSQGLLDSINRTMQRAKDGTLREEDVNFAKDLIDTYELALKQDQFDMAENEVAKFIAVYGGDGSDVFKKITGKDYVKEKAAIEKLAERQAKKIESTSLAGDTQNETGITPEQALAELERRRKEKEASNNPNTNQTPTGIRPPPMMGLGGRRGY